MVTWADIIYNIIYNIQYMMQYLVINCTALHFGRPTTQVHILNFDSTCAYFEFWMRLYPQHVWIQVDIYAVHSFALWLIRSAVHNDAHRCSAHTCNRWIYMQCTALHFGRCPIRRDKKGGVAQIGEEYSMNIAHPYSHQSQQLIVSEGVFKMSLSFC